MDTIGFFKISLIERKMKRLLKTIEIGMLFCIPVDLRGTSIHTRVKVSFLSIRVIGEKKLVLDKGVWLQDVA